MITNSQRAGSLLKHNTLNGKQVAFLGPMGTFSHGAVLSYFGTEVELNQCSTIDDVFAEVESGNAEFGVVPVENSTEGAVNNTMDCLIDTALNIVAELVLPIEHNLMVKPGTKRQDINKVLSHKQSLAQCRKWLAENLAQLPQEECASNSKAAKRASEEIGTAAIASEMAAEVYGLEILDSAIQDQRNNSTRFLIISKLTATASGRDKTSSLIYTENRPGALFRVLEPFEQHQVSLTRIETRPSKKEIWDYVFFIDFEGHVEDEPVRQVLKKLAECTVEIKLLGSYPMAGSGS